MKVDADKGGKGIVTMQNDDRITPDDILALAEAGTQAGVLDRPEQQVIENVFELDTRTVTSAMTPRVIPMVESQAAPNWS